MVSRQTFHILLTLAVVFITACGEDSRMREILDQAERHNQDFESMAGDTLLHQATAYYDRWGTSNERLRAHYLLGCHYRDLGEAPAALDEYQTAASLADTTRADCDYHTLCRVHGQMAAVFYEQLMPYDMLQALYSYSHYASLDNDTMAIINAYEKQADAYDLLANDDSIIAILLNTRKKYEECGLFQDGVIASSGAVMALLRKGQIELASKYLKEYESLSYLFDSLGFIKPEFNIYYYDKAQYFFRENNPDSAEFYLRRLLSVANSLNDREAAYQGLYQLYVNKQDKDSVAKYAELCYLTSDSVYNASVRDNLSRMHGLYNYSRHLQAAQMKEAESRQLRSMLTIVILLSLLIILFLLGLFWYLRIRYKHELQIRTKEYEYRIEKIRQARIDLSNDASKKSQEELASHENKLKELLHIGTCQNNTVDFCDTDIYHRLQYLVNHPKEKIEKKDYVALIRIFDERIPDFCFKLTNKHRIPEKDLYLCMLIRMNFGVSEICILLNTYSQYVSNRRKQLLTKYFKITGKPEDFDNIVRMVN